MTDPIDPVDDPRWHWDGGRWLWWDGQAWVAPEQPSSPVEDSASPESTAQCTAVAAGEVLDGIGRKKVIALVLSVVPADAHVRAFCQGTRDDAVAGVVAVVDDAMLWIPRRDPHLRVRIPGADLTNVFLNVGKMMATLTVTSSDGTYVFKNVPKNGAREFRAAVLAIAPSATSLTPEPTPEPVKGETGLTGRKDIDDAAAQLGKKFGSKREIRKLSEHLHPNETVEMLAAGRFGGKQGIVVLTSERVLFLADGWTGSATTDFPLVAVSSVSWVSRLGSGDLTIHASGNVAVINAIMSTDGRRMRDSIRAAITTTSDVTPTATAHAGAPVESPADTLKKLAELHHMGAITDEEYATKKQQLLDRL